MPNLSPQAFVAPLTKHQDRVTKKPFGIYITPSSSPVSPEKFTGFHTGTDFEALADEADTNVPVKTICTGKLLRKEQARGYGGMLVQACTQNNQPVTIIYGHLKLESVRAKIGDELQQGTTLGVLGKGYSTETSGERKHLHLGVHKGTQVVTNGYRPSKSDLKDWLDVMDYIK